MAANRTILILEGLPMANLKAYVPNYILGPPKHVLHLDWSVYVTFKTIKIALKVEL